MAKDLVVLPGTIVKKSNVLCRARWAVESVFEPRLVALVAARVKVDDEDFHVYEIPVRELTGPTNDGGAAYKIIHDTAESLMSRVIKIQDEGSKSFAMYNVFGRCVYDDKTKTISARFDPDLKPHYLALKNKFTEYSLLEFMMLPSVYSQRIFEILKSWTDQPVVTIALSDLHEMLNVPETLRANFAFFRRRVLEKAYKDITRKTSLRYTWEAVKKGKAVTAVTFKFKAQSSKSQPAQPTPQPEVVPDTPRGTVDADAQAIECELRSQGVHKKTAADYAARAAQGGKASAILNRLPSIIERAAGQPTAGRQRYILGAIQKELEQQQQPVDVPAASLDLEAEARKCLKEKQGAKIVCPIRKYREAGGRKRCEVCLEKFPVAGV